MLILLLWFLIVFERKSPALLSATKASVRFYRHHAGARTPKTQATPVWSLIGQIESEEIGALACEGPSNQRLEIDL